MRRRRVTAAAAACAAALLLVAGCSGDVNRPGDAGADPAPSDPAPSRPAPSRPTPAASAPSKPGAESPPTSAGMSPSPSPSEPTLTLKDVSVSGTAQGNRNGILLCGDRLVAAPPAAGIENNAFAVFDERSGKGEVTHVELPAGSGMQENARWLLVVECVDGSGAASGGPVLSFAYQEMPLPERGGVGVRGAYTLDGQLLWMRDDINLPAELVDGLLVLGAAPDQPDLIVDAVTGRTLRRFSSPLSTRIVLNHDRMVVRGPHGGPVLTDIAGDRVARLRTSGSFTADGDFIFGVNFADVVALRAGNGDRRWNVPIRLDPLGTPAVDRSAHVVVLVDRHYVAHAYDTRTGEELWEYPAEIENPRVTAAGGVVLLDRHDEGYQVLLDARSGVVLPTPPEPVVDLTGTGALMFVDEVATVVAHDDLRRPAPAPTPAEDVE